MLEPDKVATLSEKGAIEIAPLAYMRGRTLNDAFIILDEAQNTTSEQMKMFLTRLGFNSQDGDHRGHHAGRPARAAVRPASSRSSRCCRASTASGSSTSTDRDVVRHDLVSAIVRAYDEWSRRRET